MYSYLGILQARMSSARLPGKVMLTLCGKPVVWHVIERLKLSKKIDKIVVAISSQSADDTLAGYLKEKGVECSRGSEQDVLERFHKASMEFPSYAVARATADNPLVDPVILDKTIEFFEKEHYRYVRTKGFPAGIGVEVFETGLLGETFRNARSSYEREHVTPYMYTTQQSHGEYTCGGESGNVRLTMDTMEDYEFIKDIYGHFFKGAHDFFLDDILRYLNDEQEKRDSDE